MIIGETPQATISHWGEQEDRKEGRRGEGRGGEGRGGEGRGGEITRQGEVKMEKGEKE